VQTSEELYSINFDYQTSKQCRHENDLLSSRLTTSYVSYFPNHAVHAQ
jgi:hypothetical protein